jgi:hypothetical protein
VASLNGAVANEAVVKRVNYILEMSQNYEYFNRRVVTKRNRLWQDLKYLEH